MKGMRFLFAAMLAWSGVALAGLPSGWTDDFDEAKKSAAANGKSILMVFSGSDWCGWCVKFDKDTLSKSEFVKQASKKYELVMIDSPKNKSILSTKAKSQNPKLVKQYDVHGYPSYVLTDSDGAVIGKSSGYVKGGPKAFLAKLDEMMRNAPKKKGADSGESGVRVRKGSCDCGPECWEKLLCKCCKQNNGACCRKVQPSDAKRPDNGERMERKVACWTVFTMDRELAARVDETADFLEAVLAAFDEETSNYYRTMASAYDGILLHRDMEQRGKREVFVGGKHYLNMYSPDTLRTWSWCSFFCGSFLAKCKKEPLPDKDRDAMLLYVSARVAKRLDIDGGVRQLERFAADKRGLGRVLHELCSLNDGAIKGYYAAKSKLIDTDRLGSFLSHADMAEMFSGAIRQDAFVIFQKYYKTVSRDDVSIRLKGFSEE